MAWSSRKISPRSIRISNIRLQLFLAFYLVFSCPQFSMNYCLEESSRRIISRWSSGLGIFGSALIYVGSRADRPLGRTLGVALLTARIRYIYDDIKLAMVLSAIRTMLTVLQIVIPRFDSNHVLHNWRTTRLNLHQSVCCPHRRHCAVVQWSSLKSAHPTVGVPSGLPAAKPTSALFTLCISKRKIHFAHPALGYVAAILIMCMGMLLQISE